MAVGKRCLRYNGNSPRPDPHRRLDPLRPGLVHDGVSLPDDPHDLVPAALDRGPGGVHRVGEPGRLEELLHLGHLLGHRERARADLYVGGKKDVCVSQASRRKQITNFFSFVSSSRKLVLLSHGWFLQVRGRSRRSTARGSTRWSSPSLPWCFGGLNWCAGGVDDGWWRCLSGARACSFDG